MLRLESSPVSRVFKYRDRTTIMIDILDAVRNSRKEKKKTHIMQSVKMNHLQTEKYLNYLIGCGYLMVTEKNTYSITKEGSRFLQLIETQKVGIPALR